MERLVLTMPNSRMTIEGYIAMGDHEVLRALRHSGEEEVRLAFETARDGGESQVTVRDQIYQIKRNADFTFQVAPVDHSRELI